MTGILNILAGSISSAIKDGYFNLVSLLLPGNGTNGAQNNTFLDSSTNNFTITRNGNTTQGTFSPFSQTGWSNYFGGSYLETTATQIIPATGDFTIEAFVYVASLSTNPVIVSQGTTGTAGRTIFYITTAGNLYFFSNAVTAQSTGTITANSWNYVAVTRTGSSLAFYINGSASGTATVSSTVQNTVLRIGRYWNTDQDLTGYISNLRISNTVRTISSTPTSSFTSDANTILLTCQSNRFVDTSSNAYALTPTNSPSVQAFSPFAPTAAYSAATNGGSGYFDGTGDSLSIANATAIQVGATYTIEGWFYPTSSSQLRYFGKFTSGVGGWLLLADSSTFTWYYANAGSSTITGSWSPKLNSWNHIAISANSTTMRVYLNGASIGSVSSPASTQDDGSNLLIGNYNGSGGVQFLGYVSGFRIVKGSTVYDPSQTTLTVPTAPLTAITNTSLLLNFTNAGITDATGKNVLETVGNAQISTTQSKFGGSSMYFDGTGDYLYGVSNQNLILGSGDFTVEFWFYPTNVNSTNQRLVTTTTGAIGSTDLLIRLESTNTIRCIVGSTSMDPTTPTITANTWNHVALVRSGSATNNCSIYLNGSRISQGTSTSTISTAIQYIGGYYSTGPAEYFYGYIDDLRITKGYARYSGSTYTQPTAAFPLS